MSKEDKWKNIGFGVLISSESIDATVKGMLLPASLPQLFDEYSKNPKLLTSDDRTNLNLLSGTYEILGLDTKGKIYSKGEKIIIHTHNIPFKHERVDCVNEKTFSLLLEGILSTGEKVTLYDERNLRKLEQTPAKLPCISIIPAEKYLKDPNVYCYDLERRTIDDNFLLVSRTMKSTKSLSRFLESSPYFSQAYPLVENPIFHRPQTLFDKYAYKLIPLMLSDGLIQKDAPHFIDPLDTSRKNPQKHYLLSQPNFSNKKNYKNRKYFN